MDVKIIESCTELSLAGKISFPEQIKKLIANNVERYRVDLVGRKKYSYGSNNEVHQHDFDFAATQVSKIFNVQSIKQAIIDSQLNRIDYQSFLSTIMAAGCCHYEVFIDGNCVYYYGRCGNFHKELFPGQKL